MKLVKLAILSLITIFTITGCSSTKTVNSRAEQQYAEFVYKAEKAGVIDNESNTYQTIKRVFNKMTPYADNLNQTGIPFQWQITVLKLDDLNAWAMPGGKLAFYRGLVDKLQLTESEVAAVMGHEIAHVLQEHGKHSTNRSDVINTIAKLTGLKRDTGIWGLFEMPNLLDLAILKPMERNDEKNADEIGVMLMAQAGYDPHAALSMFDKILPYSSATSDFLSSHPLTSERKKDLEILLPKAMELYQKAK